MADAKGTSDQKLYDVNTGIGDFGIDFGIIGLVIASFHKRP
jgi:hypothetical protein